MIVSETVSPSTFVWSAGCVIVTGPLIVQVNVTSAL